MRESRFGFSSYPIVNEEDILINIDKRKPISIKVHDISIKIGLTPKYEKEDNCPLCIFTIIKHITDVEDKKLVALSRRYGYRLHIDDNVSPTEEELFTLLEDSAKEFAVEFSKLVQGTIFQIHRTRKLDKGFWLTKLERAIDFWNDSIRFNQDLG